MATFADLSADNPNLRQQYDEWRDQRSQNGEDPTDYQAFRQHVTAIGAPDPGESESAATGGWLAAMVTVAVAELAAPALSVAVADTV